MRIVVALGGNALLRRGEPPDADIQRRNIAAAARAIAPIVRSHEVVVTHGNGPQIGLLALQAVAYRGAEADPLDVLGAETEGAIGYLLETALANAVSDRRVATLLTQVIVDPDDPAFAAPTKPIGPVYDKAEMTRVAAAKGWPMIADGAGWRRAVPSPMPCAIREIDAVGLLLAAGWVVICAGGGGIPVVAGRDGAYRGVEAVVDKDFAAALVAERLAADHLLLLTDVPGVWAEWPNPKGPPIKAASPHALRRLAFAAGSMAPKVEAACRFVERTGRTAAIGAIEDAEAVLRGEAGTVVRST